jgi:hypothetical protein
VTCTKDEIVAKIRSYVHVVDGYAGCGYDCSWCVSLLDAAHIVESEMSKEEESNGS